MNTVHIAKGDHTRSIQKRQLGRLNIGFYCDCREFVAFAVTETESAKKIAFACDGPIEFTCPFCHQKQKRLVTEFVELVLSDGNKRRRQ